MRIDTDDRVTKLGVPRVATQPLRLRRLPPSDAAALSALFRGHDHLVLEGSPVTTWRFQLAQVVSPSGVILRGAREEIALCIDDDGLCDMLGERAWSDYGPDSQPLAWLLGHHTIIDSLGRLLGEPLLPRTRGEGSRPAGVSLSILVGFSVTTDDGRVTRGALGLSPEMTSRLAAHPSWRPRANAIDPWLALPTRLRISSRMDRFPLSELRATEIGDVLVVGRRAQYWSSLRVQRLGARAETLPSAWIASYDGTNLIVRTQTQNFEVEKRMSETPTEQTAETLPADVIARTPVTLEFELGTLTLPLGELSSLKPGYVFQLPGKLEEARVVIRAGGRRVGQGELVAVGDVLGVQVTALDADGFQ